MPLPRTEQLLATIHVLRAPDGCPWDRKQTLATAAHHLHDESAELLEAALGEDTDHVREELGDLLFMVCFVAEILGETTGTGFDDVAALADAKLVRRHPHVFGGLAAGDAGESQQRWNEVKAQEKRAKGLDPDRESLLKDLPAAAAPLHQAHRYQKDAAQVGFDWPDLEGVWAKIREEMAELDEAVAGGDAAAVEHEVGDLLFSVANLARKLDVAPDVALRRANARFRSRFQAVEAAFGGDRDRLAAASLAELEAAWRAAKAAERGAV
ncbi:MAG: nucleoside triphosphate pyrophosphohydrolase [bacterium]|nr:nucleoside triphosphate pyrophosphohydrolase [bacterium]